jgi:hypothetical protein
MNRPEKPLFPASLTCRLVIAPLQVRLPASPQGLGDGTAEIMTKACASGQSSVIERSILAS